MREAVSDESSQIPSFQTGLNEDLISYSENLKVVLFDSVVSIGTGCQRRDMLYEVRCKRSCLVRPLSQEQQSLTFVSKAVRYWFCSMLVTSEKSFSTRKARW